MRIPENQKGNFHKVVPGDELNSEAISIIKWQLKMHPAKYGSNNMYAGEIEIEGFKLHWAWELSLTDEDSNYVEWQELDSLIKDRILTQMLDDECLWGNVSCSDIEKTSLAY